MLDWQPRGAAEGRAAAPSPQPCVGQDSSPLQRAELSALTAMQNTAAPNTPAPGHRGNSWADSWTKSSIVQSCTPRLPGQGTSNQCLKGSKAPCTDRTQHINSQCCFCRIPLEVFLLWLHKSNQSNLRTGHTTAVQTAPLAGTCSLLSAAGCYNNSRAAGSASNSRTKAGKKGGQGQAVPQQPGTHGCVPGFALPDGAQISNALGPGERRTERFQLTESSETEDSPCKMLILVWRKKKI